MCVCSDAAGEAERDGALPAGHHHHPPRGAVPKTLSLRSRLRDLRGPRGRRRASLQRRSVLVLGRTPVQPHLLAAVPRLRRAVSAARPGEEVGQRLQLCTVHCCLSYKVQEMNCRLLLFSSRPSATSLIGHPFFKQVSSTSRPP